MNTSAIALDEKKMQVFSKAMMGHLNGAALSLIVSIGHRTGLFDVMAEMPPSTSADIAKRAGLNERYVREALGTLVTGGVVVHDSEQQTYFLPPEHAAFLTRKASPNNMAVTAQFISVLGSVENEIVECFKHGGGVHYDQFDRFHEVMAEESRQTVVLPMIEHLIPLAPGLRERLESGIDVLDIGCGSGYALVNLAKHFPKSRFTGYDLCQEAIERAKQSAAEEKLANVTFETKDVTKIDDRKQYDLIVTFDAIHDQAHPQTVLNHIHRLLKNDGIYLMQEIRGATALHENMEHPIGPFLYTVSCMHCMTVSLSQGGLGLGAMWGREKAVAMLGEAGFQRIDIKQLDHDMINDYYLVEKL